MRRRRFHRKLAGRQQLSMSSNITDLRYDSSFARFKSQGRAGRTDLAEQLFLADIVPQRSYYAAFRQGFHSIQPPLDFSREKHGVRRKTFLQLHGYTLQILVSNQFLTSGKTPSFTHQAELFTPNVQIDSDTFSFCEPSTFATQANVILFPSQREDAQFLSLQASPIVILGMVRR